MTIQEAEKIITECMEKMNREYTKPVFDEWTVITIKDGRGKVLLYSGARAGDIHRELIGDIRKLSADMLNNKYMVGDFEFARDAEGTLFDAFMYLGQGIFLLCNNTILSMDDITKDKLWLKAQIPFVGLADKLRASALEL